MEGIEYLYELCEALPRCGPGDNECTRRAFGAIPQLPTPPCILDIGCGPGVQTLELAKISGGKIIALDNHQPFLDRLTDAAKSAGLTDTIIPKNMSMLEMDFAQNTFDIIWAEGALYIMGFQNGVRKCRQLLKHTGYLAVTELVYLVSTPPAAVAQFFENEYPDIKDIESNKALISNEGFHVLSHFTLPESAWFANYYLPIEKELPRLSKKYHDNTVASGVFDRMRNEIDFYRKYSKFYGYEFFIAKKQLE